MDFSASSPSSTSSDSSSYLAEETYNNDPSSGNMSTDLGLDPSDPLNLLLNPQHNGDSSMDDTSPRDSPPDWSQLSSLWPVEGMKFSDLNMEYNLALPMDMDYNPSMTVEPSALHYDQKGLSPSIFSHPEFYMNNTSADLFSASFPFTFGSEDSSSASSDGDRPRRLSITSSSSSGASFSPVIASSTPAGVPTPPSYDGPLDELAQRVRQSAGVVLAVPIGPHAQQAPNQAEHLARPTIMSKFKRDPPISGSSSTSSTPPPDNATTTHPYTDSTGQGVVGRPKTNHTTIERRYRTNLNARIQSLKQAVPALRVLEDKSKSKKDVESTEKPVVDVVDERGFVDGVKLARKCSKANVLGKAVEYIRVLKKRESRLTCEQNGLKLLICGLVGGPALLKEWEREWKNKFGGAEKDEVEGEEMEPLSDDDEGDDEEGEVGESDGRAKKKAKLVKAPTKTKKPLPAGPANIQAALVGAESIVPEKRKRGRPRKVVPTHAETVSPTMEFTAASNGQQLETQTTFISPLPQGQAPQYLLATFALFSFFNSPLTSSDPSSSSHPHTHTGSVLAHSSSLYPSPSAVPAVVAAGFGWREVIQAFHLLVSALVFLSIVVPWLPASLKRHRLVSYIFRPYSWLSSAQKVPTPTQPHAQSATSAKVVRREISFDRAALIDALSTSWRGSVVEAEQLRNTLGVSTGLLGLVQSVFGKRVKETGFEQRGLEQRAWIRLGELAVLDRTTSLVSRLQTYWCACSYISFFTASTSDLSTLALVVRPLSSSKGAKLWTRAKVTRVVRPYEKLVLESLSVDEATDRLATQPSCEWKRNPISILAFALVRERLKKHTTILFVRTVLPECEWVEDVEEEKVTIDAARSLGGRTGELADMLERVWKTEVSSIDDIFDESGDENEAEREIRSLLSAVILYRRIFPSSILSRSGINSNGVSILLSPPPSPSRKNIKLYLALRRVLGASVFDFPGNLEQSDEQEATTEQNLGVALEEARDRVVDMLVDLERKSR